MKYPTKTDVQRKKSESEASWYDEKGIFKQIMWILRRLRFSLVNKFYRFRGKNYGLLEAIFFPSSIRYFLAYAGVIQKILEEKNVFSVLEVGCGGPGISSFLDLESFRICITDIEVENIKGYAKKGSDVAVVDGSKLPFRNNAFDVVVSIDTLEHIPKVIQKDFQRELKRIARKKVIITGPLSDNKGLYKAREYQDKYDLEHRNIHEHSEIPTMDQLQKEFPDAEFEGYENCVFRNFYTHLQYSLFRVVTGLVFLLFLKKWNNQPPYYSCRVTYDKAHEP